MSVLNDGTIELHRVYRHPVSRVYQAGLAHD
jgi:uncharacterized protein YndB with AHSA1/START domain